ncbi:Diphthamide biosynthesis protein 3 [Nosema bombycis CQ1]|uniref:Diphthamide biosynthesis protein 3 n=1 Tax=Nosema bombycis (strain CQ1 / CVCC 102059) TaxID=578461 RepID=R0KWA5_NOSB1|nr:Diphthamide biosynthesis protein 3 [Nosema bombycis CQ1]|eukprot:EOB15191.1 Diphthamide biosynthesis protein 3 [Nosema bombycis CQ1]
MKTFIPTYNDYFEKMEDNKPTEDDEIYYTEVDIKDFVYDDTTQTFTYPCPCGDNFEFFLEDMLNYEETARCPSCSLVVRVIYGDEDIDQYSKYLS